jgi:tetratricopeptide (TPR) repeat protein
MPSEEALDELLEFALSQIEDGREVLVLELLAQYIRFRPDDVRARWFYGESLRVVGRREEAEAEFLQVSQSQSKYSGTLVETRLAMLYDDWGNHDLAEEYWEKACAKTGAPAWAWIMRGANLAAMGKFEEAEACHRKATTLNDCDQDEAYLNLGYIARAQRRYVEAEDAFRKALEISPEYPKAIEGLRSLEGLNEALDTINKLLTD